MKNLGLDLDNHAIQEMMREAEIGHSERAGDVLGLGEGWKVSLCFVLF